MSHKFPTKFGHYKKSVKLVIVAISGGGKRKKKVKHCQLTCRAGLPEEHCTVSVRLVTVIESGRRKSSAGKTLDGLTTTEDSVGLCRDAAERRRGAYVWKKTYLNINSHILLLVHLKQ
jgi:hypothetical protein